MEISHQLCILASFTPPPPPPEKWSPVLKMYVKTYKMYVKTYKSLAECTIFTSAQNRITVGSQINGYNLTTESIMKYVSEYT